MKKKFLLFLFVIISFAGHTQNTTKINQFWHLYTGNYKIKAHWAIHLDVQARVSDDYDRTQVFIFRPGLQYLINAKQNVTLGWGYFGVHAAAIDFYIPEHRIWEQYILKFVKPKIDMTHRFRLEQRFLGAEIQNREVTAWKKGNRFRYFNRTLLSLPTKTNRRWKPYLAFQNELFLNFLNKKINAKVFDQNRAYGGFGLHRKKLRIEIGYMNQFIQTPAKPNRMIQAGQVSLFQNMDFSGMKKN
jgi:Protein of unknown function (DUF2490)